VSADDETGRYPHGGASFAAHGIAAGMVGVLAVMLVAGHHHSRAAVGAACLAAGVYFIAGAFSPMLRFGPVSRQRWEASHSRARRGVPRFNDRLVVAFDPYGRALNVVFGVVLVVYGLLRLV
jgi:hypothetical protein